MTDEVMDPQQLARSVAVETSEREDAVGDFVSSTDLGDNVTDFRFVSTLVGYEGWQWSVTLYHDEETQKWTVNESTLVPTDDSLLPPPWIPWKDRLKPSDLSVVDSIGTDENDSRLEDGFRPVNHVSEEKSAVALSENGSTQSNDNGVESNAEGNSEADARNNVEANDESNSDNQTDAQTDSSENNSKNNQDEDTQKEQNQANQANQNDLDDLDEDLEEAVSTLRLSRRRVMTAEAISQTAKRWYAGQHGPKSLSTKIADGNACSTCGFMIPLAGSLGSMFGVCANMWSPDDGRVVSLDHACGEHSEIDPPEPSQLWIQSDPAYDDYHIDILQQSPREERADVELIEEAIEDSKTHKRKRQKLHAANINKTNSNKEKQAERNKAEDSSQESEQSSIQENQNQASNDSENKTLDIQERANQIAESQEVSEDDENEKTEEIQIVSASIKSAESDISKSDQPNKTDQQDSDKTDQNEERAKVTSSTAMHLYKRKARRQHK